MIQMKFIHSLSGILSLLLILVMSIAKTGVLALPLTQASIAYTLLLATTVSNLLLGAYLVRRCGFKHYVQVTGSLCALLSLLLALCLAFNPSLTLGTVSGVHAIHSLLVLGAACHFLVNLNALDPASRETEASDESRETGTVKWFNVSKGFGFITRDQGDDIFVHYRAIRGDGHRTLSEGQRVDFTVVENSKGLQAEDVNAARRRR